MIDENEVKKFFKEAHSRAQQLEREKVKNAKIDSGNIEFVRNRLYRMIEYGIQRHDWYDEQRLRFVQIGLALMAASIGIFALFANLDKYLNIVTELLLLVLSTIIFLTGLRLVYLYNQGIARNYPYRKIVDIRSWYFVYNFPSGLKDNLSKNSVSATKEINEIIESLGNFFDRWLSYTKDKNLFLKEDLEQVFILQLLQRYRSQQVKSMSKTLHFGVWASFVVFVLIFLSFMYFANSIDVENLDSRKDSIQTEFNGGKITNGAAEEYKSETTKRDAFKSIDSITFADSSKEELQ